MTDPHAPHPHSTPDELAHEVLMSIRQIVRKISEHSHELSKSCGLSVPQLLCLKAVGELREELDEVTVQRVSDRVQLSKATTSRMIDKLTKVGLFSCERGVTDRRRVCVSLTPAGEERFATLPRPLQEVFVQRLEALELAERQQLLSSLKLVATLMEAHELDAAPMLTLRVEESTP